METVTEPVNDLNLFADETPPEVVQKTYKEQLQAHQGGAPLAMPESAISSAEDVRDPATGVPGGIPTPPVPPPSTADYILDIAKSAPSDLAKLATETAMAPVSIGRMGSIESPPEDRPWYRQTLPQLLGYEEYAKPAREALAGGRLYGRGSSDMKSGIAAFVICGIRR
jgi:hypothetical protein